MKISNLGLIPYQGAWEYQKSCVTRVTENRDREEIIICHHPAVVTLGKKSTPSDLCGWQGETVAIERGGKATYHGPSQIVVYPILDLKKRGNDIYKYLRNLEMGVVELLSLYGLSARGDHENTGVWCQEKKIASIGVAIKKWVTYHGIAFNIYRDEMAFKGINPCGFETNVMSSLEEMIHKKIGRESLEDTLAQIYIETFKTN